MKIEEGSKIEVFINGDKSDEVIAAGDLKIYDNHLLMTRTHGLVCTQGTNPVRKTREGYYQIYCWLQDASGISENGYLYDSVGDMD